MARMEFMTQLKKELRKKNVAEQEDYIWQYNELLDDYMEHGMTEMEAIRKVGKPEEIAQEIKENQEEVYVMRSSVGLKIGISVLLILGLPLWGSLLLTVILLVGIAYFLIWLIPFIAGLIGGSLLVGSCAIFIAVPFIMSNGLPNFLCSLGIGLLMFGSAVFCILTTIMMCRFFAHLSVQLSKRFLQLFKRRVMIR